MTAKKLLLAVSLLVLASACNVLALFWEPNAVELVIAVDGSDQAAVQQTMRALSERAATMGMRRARVEQRSLKEIVLQVPKRENMTRLADILLLSIELELRVVDAVGSRVLDTIELPPDSEIERRDYLFDGRDGNRVREAYWVGPSKEAMAGLCVGKLPSDRDLLFGPEQTDPADGRKLWRTYLVEREVGLSGDRVVDARPQQDEMGGYYVTVTLDEEGARTFAALTGAHVRDKLAIILDGTVNSAPLVMERIDGGVLRITLGRALGREGSLKEARDLALLLKVKPLPLEPQLLGIRNLESPHR